MARPGRSPRGQKKRQRTDGHDRALQPTAPPAARATTAPALSPSAAALLLAMTLLAYAPAMRAGYFWDDREYVTDNVTLRSAPGLWQIWFEPRATPQYYPATFTTLWAEYQLWGLAPAGYHVTNVALHGANVLLVWGLLRRLNVAGAFAAAAAFALHPVHVESVAWITERKNVLSSTWCLLSVLMWLRYLDTRRARAYGAALALFAAAMLSKTAACTLPFDLLLLTWWKAPTRWRREMPRIASFVAIGVGLALVTMWREHLGPKGDVVTRPLSIIERGLVAGRALWFYAGKLLWPAPLITVYPRWEIDAGSVWQYAFPLAAVAVLFGLWTSRRRWGPGPLVGVLCFVITLAPVLGFVYFDFTRLSYVADRYPYLASIGLIALTAAAVTTGTRRLAPRRRWVPHAVAAVWLAILAVLTWRQAALYHDPETLWRHTLAQNPDAMMAHYNLGTILGGQGKLDAAIEQFRAAARLDPHYVPAQNNWGTALDKQGKPDEALQHFRTALQLNPTDSVAHFNSATVLAKQGHTEEAITHLNEALRSRPAYPSAHYNVGSLLLQQGRVDEAVQHLRAALRLQPNFPRARARLQQALAQQGASP